MDIKKIFEGVSTRLRADFSDANEINHNVTKGSYRESSLKKMLKTKLPAKYGLSNGEIVGYFKNNVSKQIDIIIFNQHEFTPLLSPEDNSIFPIESVYGIIEVKSKLSKDELLKGLENIKSVKMLAPKDIINVSSMPAMSLTMERPIPFGIIFAYALENNSLNSLVENLKSWEVENPNRLYWPNLIVILDVGIIFHGGDNGLNCYTNSSIMQYYKDCRHIKYEKETILQFYLILMDLCSSTTLGPLKLHNYANPYLIVGDMIVRGHNNLSRLTDSKKVKLRGEFVKSIYTYCISNENCKITYGNFLLRVSNNITEESKNLPQWNQQIYLYNPNNLKSANVLELEINYNWFFLPVEYIGNEQIEEYE